MVGMGGLVVAMAKRDRAMTRMSSRGVRVRVGRDMDIRAVVVVVVVVGRVGISILRGGLVPLRPRRGSLWMMTMTMTMILMIIMRVLLVVVGPGCCRGGMGVVRRRRRMMMMRTMS